MLNTINLAAASFPPILAVAGDPGGAAALLPILQRLGAQGVPLLALAYRQALPAWQTAGIATQALPESPGGIFPWPDEARLLLTATSVNGVDWEPRSWQSARDRSVPSLAVLDYWSNLRSRFLIGQQTVLPDRIALMDESARRGMIAAGIPADKLLITGQPAFDDLGSLIPHGAAIRRRLRAAEGIAEKQLLVVFASQPLAQLRQQAGFADYGYDEHTALELLASALQAIAAQRQLTLRLLVRPHPREKDSDLQRHVLERPGLQISIVRGGNAREWALAADLVCGMHTVLLQEACYLECPVLSLQPGLRGEDPLPANRQKLSCSVTDPAKLPAALEKMLFEPATRAAFAKRQRDARPTGNATEKIIELARNMLDEKIASHPNPVTPEGHFA